MPLDDKIRLDIHCVVYFLSTDLADTTATFYEQVKTRLPKLMETGFKLNTGVQEIQYSHRLTVTFEDHYITITTNGGN